MAIDVNELKQGAKAAPVFLILLVLLVLYASAFTVQSGTRKLVFSAGKLTSVAGEGLHFKIPLYQTVKKVPKYRAKWAFLITRKSA